MMGRTLYALALVVASLLAAAPGAIAGGPEEARELHGEFDRLLKLHVVGLGVDYATWHADEADVTALGRYVDELAAIDPADWSREDGLAYWINMYNAVTLRLILDNYPLDSIKDIGGLFNKSPWKRKLVEVGGRKLTLNDIENDIIRPTYEDARAHFAINCASIGCPPLRAEACLPELLDSQLDASCRLALNLDRWVSVTNNEVKITKIFDWYRGDFVADGASLLEFINRYRDEKLPADTRGFGYLPYDWSLNSSDK